MSKTLVIFILEGKEYSRKFLTNIPRKDEELLFISEPFNTMIVELVVYDYISTDNCETVNIGIKRRTK